MGYKACSEHTFMNISKSIFLSVCRCLNLTPVPHNNNINQTILNYSSVNTKLQDLTKTKVIKHNNLNFTNLETLVKHRPLSRKYHIIRHLLTCNYRLYTGYLTTKNATIKFFALFSWLKVFCFQVSVRYTLWPLLIRVTLAIMHVPMDFTKTWHCLLSTL